MDENEIIKAWQAGDCKARLAFVEYLQEQYGKNLANALDCEDKNNA